jgi:thymidine kinase
MTQRLVGGQPAPFHGETIQVGALDSYEARCRACFQPGVDFAVLAPVASAHGHNR